MVPTVSTSEPAVLWHYVGTLTGYHIPFRKYLFHHLKIKLQQWPCPFYYLIYSQEDVNGLFRCPPLQLSCMSLPPTSRLRNCNVFYIGLYLRSIWIIKMVKNVMAHLVNLTCVPCSALAGCDLPDEI